jgi:hypothetical protein
MGSDLVLQALPSTMVCVKLYLDQSHLRFSDLMSRSLGYCCSRS